MNICQYHTTYSEFHLFVLTLPVSTPNASHIVKHSVLLECVVDLGKDKVIMLVPFSSFS